MVRTRRHGLLVPLFALVVVSALQLTTGFGPVDEFYFDLWHQLAGKRDGPEHVAIVSIGDEALLRRKDEPLVFWGPHFAKALATLRAAGAAQIGVDVLFSVNAGAWLRSMGIPGNNVGRTFDLAMRKELASGKVVLAASVAAQKDAKSELLLPTPEYLYALPGQRRDVGLTNLYTDPDGVVRRFVPAFWDEDEALMGLSLPMLLALRAKGAERAKGLWPLGSGNVPAARFPLRVGYLGPPGTVPRLAFDRLLAPGAQSDPAVRELAGKIVFIAVEPKGLQDVHLTPYSGGLFGAPSMMKGAEVQANVVETILTGNAPHEVGPAARWAFLLACVGGMSLLVLRGSQLQAGAGACALCAACAMASHAAFSLSNTLLPVAQGQVGILAAFLGGLGLRLGREERKRAWLQQTFGKYVSTQVVDQLLKGGSVPDLGGETRTVTVLFSDIRNFTTISEKMTPHEVMEMLNTYFDRVCTRIMAREGMVDKFIGDAVMAVFGSPCPHRDHARLAIAAALDMMDEARAFRSWMAERFAGRDIPEFAIGIGLHSGEVVVGNVGSTQRLEFTALGDAVNLASRLESATKQLGWPIVASRAAVDMAGADVVVGGGSTIQVKGRVEPVEALEIKELKERNHAA